MIHFKFFAKLFIFFVVLCCVNSTIAKANQDSPLIVVSINPQAYLVKRIAENLVRVEVILPSSANHELFEPSIVQLRRFSKAKIFFTLGQKYFPFEMILIRQLQNQSSSIKIIDLSEGIIKEDDDPHIWLNPNFVRVMVSSITDTLLQLLPDHKNQFELNKVKLLQDIDQLVVDLHQLFANKRQRKFIVFHDSWKYFADQFGLEQIAIEVEGKEADIGRISKVIKLAKNEGIRTIFIEPGFSSSSAQLIAEEIGGSLEVIDPFAFDWIVNMKHVGQVINKSLTDEDASH